MAATALLTADAILFAINSAIKLSHSIRGAYAQSIRGKKLALPLPDFNPNIEFGTVYDFFEGHPEYPREVDRLQQLHQEADENMRLDDKDKQREYLEFYHAYHSLHLGKSERPDMNADDLANLFRIRQWAHEEKHQSVLQLVAGAIVELGIDYFLQTPGALNTESAQGRIMHHFLTAFDEIDFSESRDIKIEISNKLVPRLFAAAAESFAEMSPEITEDEKFQQFIKETTKGIANTLYEKSKAQPWEKQQEAAYWGQMVLRSMINNAGTFVFSAPEALFNTNKPVSEIIQTTGLTLLNAILDDDDEEKIHWRKAISADTLDDIARSTLEIVAEHPNVIGGDKGVQKIISEVALAVKDEDFRQQGLIPEIARIVLEKSAGNLELLWRVPPPSTPGGPKHPEHLLVLAAQQLLSILSEKHGDAPWRPALTKAHLLGLTYDLLDEVVQNPSWVTDKVNEDSVLAEVLDITFRSLSQIPKEERLNAETIRWLIRLSMQAALTSKKVLDEVPWGKDDEKVVALEKALNLIFTCVFPKDTPPDVNRMELLAELTEYIMDVVLSQNPGRRGLVLIDLILFESGIDYSEGFDRELADELLDAAFDTLANRPELLTKHEGLKAILSDVAGAVSSAKLDQPGLLPFLVQLVLEKTAQNAHLVIDADTEQPRHLLTIALRHILTALSNKDSQGNWRPEVSIIQAQGLIETLLEETVAHPFWITEKVNQDSLLAEVLDTTFAALAQVPKEERLAPDMLETLIQLNLQMVAASPKVLSKITFAEDQEEKAILQRALSLVFTFTFPKEGDSPESRIHLLEGLLDYSLGVVMARHPDEKGLILLDLILFNSGIDYSQGFDEVLADQLADAALDALAARPELLAKPQALRNILSGLAGAIDSARLRQPGLLPFLVRLALENTALNAGLIIGADTDQPRHLLSTALEDILTALSAQDDSGRWRPEISPAAALSLTENLLDEVARHPNWVTGKVNQNSLLSELLNVTFNALANIPEGERLSPETLEWLTQLNIRAVAASPHLLQRVAFATDAEEKAILERALDLVFAFVFPKDGTTEATRIHLFTELLDYILTVIMAHHPNKRGLILADLILFENNGIDFTAGFDEGLAGQLVESALNVLAQHPELATRDQLLKKIIRDIATSLKDSEIGRPELLPELIRLALHYTALHLDQVFDLEEDAPEHLLVIAAREVLRAIAEKPRSGKWKPRLSNEQVMEVLEIVFEAVTEYPQWIQAEEVIYHILEAVFRALEVVDKAHKLPFIVLRRMIESALEAAYRQRQFIVKIQTREGAHRQIMLRYSLESLFLVIYDENKGEEAVWRLSQAEVLNSIIDYYLLILTETPGSVEDVDQAMEHMRKVIAQWKKDLSRMLEEVLEELEELDNSNS